MKTTHLGTIVCLFMTFLVGVSLPGYAQERVVRQAQRIRPDEIVVGSGANKKVSLRPGGDMAIIFVSRQGFEMDGDAAIIFLNDQFLDGITSAQVVINDRPVPEVEVRLGPATTQARELTLQARAGAEVSDAYQLRLIAGSQVIDVPLNVLRLDVEASPVLLGPRVYSPGPRVAETMEQARQRRGRSDAQSFSSDEFGSIVSEVFANATFSANACGGSYTYRNTIIHIPNLLHSEESLDRLDYELTDGEKDRSQWLQIVENDIDYKMRRSQIRACVDDWQAASWAGGIDGGRFEITIGFGPGKKAIKGRAIDQWRAFGVWRATWDWNAADYALPDYRMSDLQLLVTLTPGVVAGGITYNDVAVRWSYGDWGFTEGSFRLNGLEGKIVNYKNDKMNTIRQRIEDVFNRPDVRSRLSQAITDQVTANPLVNEVVSLGEDGTNLEVEYE